MAKDRVPLRVGTVAALVGLLTALTLVVMAVIGGTHDKGGESIEWLANYLALAGFPLSLLASYLIPVIEWLHAPVLMPVALVLGVAINWGAIGYLGAWLLRALRQSWRSRRVDDSSRS